MMIIVIRLPRIEKYIQKLTDIEGRRLEYRFGFDTQVVLAVNYEH